MENISKKDIFAAILAGGKGERLWPKSRLNLPKQNLRILTKGTIIQDAVRRAKKIASGNRFVITNRESLSNTIRQLKKFKIKRIIVEPIGRNTAPAIGLATLLTFRENSNSILVAMPSDHLIVDDKRFFDAIDTAVAVANKEDVIVALGIKPTSPESVYGYIGIEAGLSHLSSKNSYKVIKFIEKPRLLIAKKLMSNGRYFWNSGIFIFKTLTMLQLLKKHMPVLYRGLAMLPDVKDKHRFDRELERLYKKLKSDSLDYAILEKSSKDIRVIPSDFEWSDIGSFNSVARLVKKDRYGNAIFGSHVGIDTEGCVIFSDANHLVGTIGIKDLIVVVTSDAVLACRRQRAEDIKDLVERIKKKKNLLKFL